jgi:hypothetical protein
MSADFLGLRLAKKRFGIEAIYLVDEKAPYQYITPASLVAQRVLELEPYNTAPYSWDDAKVPADRFTRKLRGS